MTVAFMVWGGITGLPVQTLIGTFTQQCYGFWKSFQAMQGVCIHILPCLLTMFLQTVSRICERLRVSTVY